MRFVPTIILILRLVPLLVIILILSYDYESKSICPLFFLLIQVLYGLHALMTHAVY